MATRKRVKFVVPGKELKKQNEKPKNILQKRVLRNKLSGIVPGTIFKILEEDDLGNEYEEIHVALPVKFSNAVETLKVRSPKLKDGEMEKDFLPKDVSWNYKIEILHDYVFRFEAESGKIGYKLSKRRESRDNTEETKTQAVDETTS